MGEDRRDRRRADVRPDVDEAAIRDRGVAEQTPDRQHGALERRELATPLLGEQRAPDVLVLGLDEELGPAGDVGREIRRVAVGAIEVRKALVPLAQHASPAVAPVGHACILARGWAPAGPVAGGESSSSSTSSTTRSVADGPPAAGRMNVSTKRLPRRRAARGIGEHPAQLLDVLGERVGDGQHPALADQQAEMGQLLLARAKLRAAPEPDGRGSRSRSAPTCSRRRPRPHARSSRSSRLATRRRPGRRRRAGKRRRPGGPEGIQRSQSSPFSGWGRTTTLAVATRSSREERSARTQRATAGRSRSAMNRDEQT